MEHAAQQSSRQSCSSCKKQKRKCDRELPICGFCAHTKRRCDYEDVSEKPPSASDFAALQARLEKLEQRLLSPNLPPPTPSDYASSSSNPLHGSINTTTTKDLSLLSLHALFLDIDLHTWTGLQMPRPQIQLPVDVVETLTQNENAIIAISEAYFSTVQHWLPIVSKKRMDLGFSIQSSGPDVAMLFLAMKLLISQGDMEPGHNSLYSTTKRFLARLEANGYVSFLCLQSMVLVATFEYGHAIYPAAWMTVAACSRYAEMLDISLGKGSSTISGSTQSWTGQEECRRTLWAIYILDRLICLGNRRSFAVPEPSPDAVLPIDDIIWDAGDASQALHQSVSTSFCLPQPHFTRLCQAAMLISRATLAVRDTSASETQFCKSFESLSDEICSWLTNSEPQLKSHGPSPISQSLAPCSLGWSALYMILDKMCCPEKLTSDVGFVFSGKARSSDELAMQAKAMDLTLRVSNQMHEVANHLVSLALSASGELATLDRVSPFCLDSLYCAMVSFHWLRREGGNHVHKTSVTALEHCLTMLGKRWNLGKAYVALSERYDAFNTMLSE